MSAPAAGEEALFEHAPPIGIQQRLRLVTSDNLYVRRRALLFALIAWAPLVLLASLQAALLRTDDFSLVLAEVGVHARYLIAGPLLIVAEAACATQLNAIARHFARGGIVADSDGLRFAQIIASTRRLVESRNAEIVVVLLAYSIVAAALVSYPFEQLPRWATSRGISPVYSPAGWWQMLVSLPFLLALMLGWAWRALLWARLLWLVSRLELQLAASHPDRCAGLGFLGRSVRAFAIVALALAAIVAGGSAQIVLESGTLPLQHIYFIVSTAIAIVTVCAAPLVAFTPTLMRTWRHGTFEYGVLADRVGHSFERKWIGRGVCADESALAQPDFSATADLYAIVSNVHAMRFVPIDAKDMFTLAIAILLPFLPVVLLAIPVAAIWTEAMKLLF